MTPERRRLFIIGLAAVVLLLFVAGFVSAYHKGSSPICPDGKPPVAENRDEGLGKTYFRCQNGQVVTR